MQVFQKVLVCRCFQSIASWFLVWFLCCLQCEDTAAQPCSTSSEGRKGLGHGADIPTLHIICWKRVGVRLLCSFGAREPLCWVLHIPAERQLCFRLCPQVVKWAAEPGLAQNPTPS